MNLETFSLLTCVGGLMMTGFVHNPKFLVIGIVLIVINQCLNYYCGYRRGRRSVIPKTT